MIGKKTPVEIYWENIMNNNKNNQSFWFARGCFAALTGDTNKWDAPSLKANREFYFRGYNKYAKND